LVLFAIYQGAADEATTSVQQDDVEQLRPYLVLQSINLDNEAYNTQQGRFVDIANEQTTDMPSPVAGNRTIRSTIAQHVFR
jgi:hypothetical protein